MTLVDDSPQGGAAGPTVPDARASEAMLAAILSIAADAIITVDDAERIMHFNSGAEQIFGYAAAEIVGHPLELLLPERYRAAHHGHVRQFGAGQHTARQMGHRREIFGLRRNGEEFPAEASISKLELPDGRTVYSAVLRDITERKRVEQEQRFLATASSVLASSLDVAATMAVVPDLAVPMLADWCALAVLEADETIHRVAAPHADPALAGSLEELFRRYPLDWDSPWVAVDVLRTGRAELVAHVSDDWLEARVVDAEHHRLLRRVGSSSLLSVPLVARERVIGALTMGRMSARRPFDDGDLAVARDLGLRAALALDSARLYRAAQRATRERDVVLGVVSHDLRNPLSAIAMCASVLRESPPEAAADRRTLADTIHESAEWMQRLMRDLLDVAALEAGALSLERRDEDVGAIMQRLRSMFEHPAAEGRLTFAVDVVPGVDAILADGERVLQVLANLVGNAVKFTEPGGTVAARAEPCGREVRFSVADTGPGIPVESVPRVFELYWHARHSGRRRGSGYGLAIARGLVEAHGGRIWVESTPGVGSTFYFTVPAGGTAGAAAGETAPAAG
ncbi:MAG TPA: ATP-binding protein [Gemmatimonadaceae bacterium]|nr:ATP-binding protein [Gemmatimonadaceae bacterium]